MGFIRWFFLGFFGWVFLGGFFNANPAYEWFLFTGRSLVNHRLCMSRSIGDLELKSLGVTAVPDIKQVLFHLGPPCSWIFASFLLFNFSRLLEFAPGNELVDNILYE